MAELFTPWWHIEDTNFRHERRYSTAVAAFRDGGEQRECLTLRPKERVSYLVRMTEARETGLVDRLLYGNRAGAWEIPFWPHQDLSGGAAPGASVVISVPQGTAGRRFRVGGRGILYRGPLECEAFTIEAVGPTSVTAASITGTWTAGTLVMPLELGRLAGDFELTRQTVDVADFAASFELELPPNPGIASPSSADVFRACPVQGAARASDRWDRGVERLESPSSTSRDFAVTAFPLRGWTPELWVEGVAQAQALQDFFDAQKGSHRGFWMPTWQADLERVASGGNLLQVRAIGYTAGLFPLVSRRHLALMSTGADRAPDASNLVHRTVTAAVDNGDGTETLTLDGGAGNPTLSSFMLYSRIDGDTLAVEWENPLLARCAFPLKELAAEVTA